MKSLPTKLSGATKKITNIHRSCEFVKAQQLPSLTDCPWLQTRAWITNLNLKQRVGKSVVDWALNEKTALVTWELQFRLCNCKWLWCSSALCRFPTGKGKGHVVRKKIYICPRRTEPAVSYIWNHRLRLRNNQLKFKTAGNKPIILEEFIVEYTPV